MENYLLYEDEEQRVEIDGRTHLYLKLTKVEEFRLERYQLNYVLMEIFDLLKTKNKELKNTIIVGNIPIISAAAPFNLEPPHDVFNEALDYLRTYQTLDDKREEINQALENDFPGVYGYIFPHRIYDIKGFLTSKVEDDDVIFFFGFKDGMNFLEFLL